MRRKIYRLVLLVLTAALLSACAGDDKPTVSAQSASTSITKLGGEGTSMPQSTINLSWLDQVVLMLQTNTTRKEAIAAFFGINLANVSSDGWSAVSKYGLVKVRIYDLPHVAIDIAVDVVFEDGSRPRIGDLEARLGSSYLLPRAPDDFSSSNRVAFYPQSGKSPAFVRVFAELEKDKSTVIKLQIDRTIPSSVSSEPTVPKC